MFATPFTEQHVPQGMHCQNYNISDTKSWPAAVDNVFVPLLIRWNENLSPEFEKSNTLVFVIHAYEIQYFASIFCVLTPQNLDVCVRHRLFPTIKLLCRIPLSPPPSNILRCPERSSISSYKMVVKWQTSS